MKHGECRKLGYTNDFGIDHNWQDLIYILEGNHETP